VVKLKGGMLEDHMVRCKQKNVYQKE